MPFPLTECRIVKKKSPLFREGNSFIRRGQIRLLFAGYTPVGFFIGLDFDFSSYWILDLVFHTIGFHEFFFELGFGFSDFGFWFFWFPGFWLASRIIG
jgi:hypothetical protein